MGLETMVINSWDVLDITETTEPLSVGYHFKRFVNRHIDEDKIPLVIGIVCSELASNIIKYGEKGTISCRIIENSQGKTVEIIAEDYGKGIKNIELALKDGFTDQGPIILEEGLICHTGMGTGLPAVKRLMDEIEILSKEKEGTIIIARKNLT
jgi:anti-sigma regulatory factor (Ser/Thr protein kinase)